MRLPQGGVLALLVLLIGMVTPTAQAQTAADTKQAEANAQVESETQQTTADNGDAAASTQKEGADKIEAMRNTQQAESNKTNVAANTQHEATDKTEAAADRQQTANTTKTSPDTTVEADTQPKDVKNGLLGTNGKFFLKQYSTRTWTFLSSFTSTVPYTCYTTGANAPMLCMGRKLRRSRKIDLNMDSALDPSSLDSSGPEGLDSLDAQERDAEQKFFFRLYRTLSTTATITTFSTNRSVTVSVSVMCTFAGQVLNIC